MSDIFVKTRLKINSLKPFVFLLALTEFKWTKLAPVRGVSKCSVRDSDQLVVLDEVEEDFADEDYEDIDEHDEL